MIDLNKEGHIMLKNKKTNDEKTRLCEPALTGDLFNKKN